MKIKEKFTPIYREKKRSFVLLFILVGIYLYSCSKGVSFIDNSIDRYLVKPLMWGGLIFLVWKMPRLKVKSMKRLKGSVSLWAFIFGLMYILSLLGVGLFMGLGKSPYGHGIRSIMMNVVMFAIPLIGREVVRSYVINNTDKKYKWMAIMATALLMAFLKEDISRYLRLQGIEDIAMFFGNYGMENISTSLMASYLAYLGGTIPTIIYMGMIWGFEFMSPILPNLQWLLKALVSTIVPLFSFMIMQEIYSKESKDKDYQRETMKAKKESTIGWFFTVCISISIIWFTVGVFPIYPLVIATGSMEPMIKPGDMVIYRKVNEDTVKLLQKGDVINFKDTREGASGDTITHRIIEVKDIEGMRCYLTKGDNNTSVDIEPVKMNDIKGKYVKHIPKIGWPSLIIKSKEVDKEKYEY